MIQFVNQRSLEVGTVPDTPDLFEPNPLLKSFIYPMGDTMLSESCPASALSLSKPKQEVQIIILSSWICYCCLFSAIVWLFECENTSIGSWKEKQGIVLFVCTVMNAMETLLYCSQVMSLMFLCMLSGSHVALLLGTSFWWSSHFIQGKNTCVISSSAFLYSYSFYHNFSCYGNQLTVVLLLLMLVPVKWLHAKYGHNQGFNIIIVSYHPSPLAT